MSATTSTTTSSAAAWGHPSLEDGPAVPKLSRKAQRRAGHDARKQAAEWRFGVGQSKGQERAEIQRAKFAGRVEEYMLGQAQNRADPKPPKRAPRRTSDTRGTARTGFTPCVTATSVLADLPESHRMVAQDIATLARERTKAGDTRAVPYSYRFGAGRLDMSQTTVQRALRHLVGRGYLTAGEPLDPLPGHQYGTRTYGLGSARRDGANGDNGQTAIAKVQVPVGPRAVEALSEPVGQVEDIVVVDGAEVGVQDGLPPASGGPALVALVAEAEVVGVDLMEEEVRVVGHGHTLRGAGSSRWLARALEAADMGAKTENDAAVWLACQLRDNGITADDAVAPMLQYAEGSGYSSRRAMATLKSVNRRPPREPARKPASTQPLLAPKAPGWDLESDSVPEGPQRPDRTPPSAIATLPALPETANPFTDAVSSTEEER